MRPNLVAITAWTRRETEAENIEVNGGAVRHLLAALEPAGSVRHVALMTGLKHYLGPFEAYAVGKMPDTPFHEYEPRLSSPNFYYAQEDELFAGAERNGFTWSVHRAHTVFGFATGNAMNMVATICAYATICKETGRPFVFPGSETQWNGVTDVTDAELLAEQILWCATDERGQNEPFNIANGDVFRWRWLWPQVAEYFGLDGKASRASHAPSRRRWQVPRTWRRDRRAPRPRGTPARTGRVVVAHRRRPRTQHRGAHRHEQEQERRLRCLPRHPRRLLPVRRALSSCADHPLSTRGAGATSPIRPACHQPLGETCRVASSSMWALMVAGVGWWAVSSAAFALSMSKCSVTIPERSMPL